MITDSLLGIVFNFVSGLFELLPFMDISVDLSVSNTFLDIIGGVLYFFPWQKVLPILSIIIMLQVWRIMMSIIKALWSVIPIL